MCGGPSATQQQAQQSQAGLADELKSLFQSGSAITTPFYSNMVKSGLPFAPAMTDYSGGTLAQSYAPVKAAAKRSLAGYGSSLPSGFATRTMGNINDQQARDFDNQMIQNQLLNQQAKQQGAAGLNPLGTAGAAQGGYTSVMQAPVSPSPLGSILGGAAGGLLSAI